VLENLKRIINKAKKVILMQYDIKASDAEYFLSFIGADLYDDQQTYKRKVVE
jgi:hypothetical protein